MTNDETTTNTEEEEAKPDVSSEEPSDTIDNDAEENESDAEHTEL